MMKKFVLLLLSMSTAFVLMGATPPLVVHNNAEYAAKELQFHLEAITGQPCRMVMEKEFDGKSSAFYVGDTAFARKHGIDVSHFAPEEWLYRTVGDDVILTGAADYAVVEFLEKELGCRWYTYESERIPKREKLEFGQLNRRGKPAFVRRQIYTPPWAQNYRDITRQYTFERRQRARSFTPPLRESPSAGSSHNFYEYVDPDRYFKSNPEYFSMNEKGERFHGDKKARCFGQLCLSNPEVARVATEQLERFIQADRAKFPREQWPTLYDISELDSTNYICLCPECKKLTAAEGSESALVITFINRIAAAIALKYPKITLRTFAYVSTEKAPKTLAPAKNVQIQWCDVYTRSDCYRPLTHQFNARQKAILEGWRAKGARLAIWDYWNMAIAGPYFDPPRVETMLDAIAADIRYFKEIGVEAFFVEAETFVFRHPQNFYDLQNYLGHQLLNDPNKNEEVLIIEFMNDHYGPAAPEMKRFLTELRAAVRSEKKALVYITNPVREYQTGEFLRRTYDTLQCARAATAPDTPYRFRVEKELITPIAAILSHPSLKTGLDRKKLLEEYAAYRKGQIETHCKDIPARLKELENDLVKLALEIPTPSRFKNVPPEKIKKFAYPVFSNVVDDPDSVLGKAMASPDNPRELIKHKMEPQAGGLYPTWIGLYDWDTRKSAMLKLTGIPADEKYHWYKIGRFDIGRRTKLWAWFWLCTADLSSAWTNADGVPDFNVYDVYASVKVTGPTYVKGSTKPNRVYIDQIILIKP